MLNLKKDKTIVITGGNSGIGLETVKYFKDDYNIIIGARNEQKANQIINELNVDTINFIKLDLESQESIDQFVKKIDGVTINILINNSGIFCPSYKICETNYESQFTINHLGHFYLTYKLLDQIKDKIIIVSSIAHRAKSAKINFDDINYENNYKRLVSYKQSKLACTMFGHELAKRLESKKSKVKVYITHPGLSVTDITRSYGGIAKMGYMLGRLFYICQSSTKGAMATNFAVENNEYVSGSYFGPSKNNERVGEVKLLKLDKRATNDNDNQKLWKLSEEVYGIKFL